VLILLFLFFPLLLGEVELFVDKDVIVSPVHIVPEIYFLRFYAVLRAVPNKVLGVLIIGSMLLEFFLIGVGLKGRYFPVPVLFLRSVVISFILTLVFLS